MRNRVSLAALCVALALACPARATVTSTASSANYTCTGAVTTFTIPFPYLATSQIVATQTDAAGVVTTVIGTVKPSIAPTSGTLTLPSACPAGSTLTISRSVALTQPQSFRTGSYSGAAHEQAFDKLTMETQQNAATHAADKTAQTAKDAAQDLAISGVNGAVAALNTGSHAVTDASSVLAFGSTTPRTLTSRFADVANVRDYGAKGDGITDDTAAVQAAWNSGAASARRIYFPAGTYLVSAPIAIASSFSAAAIVGENMSAVTIKATASMAAVFQFTDTGGNGYFSFSEVTIDGNHLAAKGIVSTQLRYIRIDRLVVKATTTAAVDLSQGWDQNITASNFQNNDGDGLRLGANANNVSIRGCVISLNGGWGVTALTGSGINLYSNDISNNSLGGIYVSSGSGTVGAGTINIRDNYFEGNAAALLSVTLTSGSASVTASAAAVATAAAHVGHAMVGSGIPAGTTVTAASGTTITMSAAATATQTSNAYVTVGILISPWGALITADILLNGSADPAALAQTYPISNANIEGNTSTSYGATQFVAYANSAVNSLRVVGNTHVTAYSLVAQIMFSSLLTGGGLPAMTIEGNQGFTGSNGVGPHFHDRAFVSCSTGTAVVDVGVAEEFIIQPPSTGACTVNAPANVFWTTTRPNYRYITVRVRNALGGGLALGAFTWTAGAGGYRLAAWTNPADGFSRSITFSWDVTSNAWVEESRTPADVPN